MKLSQRFYFRLASLLELKFQLQTLTTNFHLMLGECFFILWCHRIYATNCISRWQKLNYSLFECTNAILKGMSLLYFCVLPCSQDRCCAKVLLKVVFGTAPTTVLTCPPPLNAIKVGIPRRDSAVYSISLLSVVLHSQ